MMPSYPFQNKAVRFLSGMSECTKIIKHATNKKTVMSKDTVVTIRMKKHQFLLKNKDIFLKMQ